ncbi:hypothetical protein J6590_024067 [Homalodisca vitripennis]|nr:hypothetical protein J6590_024067 [Homalodisca vitripennis]
MERYKLSRSQSAGRLGETKKPPPRPPPPMKLLLGSKLSSSASYHNQLGLTQPLSVRNKSGGTGTKKLATPSGMLIDFNSPPSSPTLTACSSSDGFSLNSFGSDGLLTSFNNTSSQIIYWFVDEQQHFQLSEFADLNKLVKLLFDHTKISVVGKKRMTAHHELVVNNFYVVVLLLNEVNKSHCCLYTPVLPTTTVTEHYDVFSFSGNYLI